MSRTAALLALAFILELVSGAKRVHKLRRTSNVTSATMGPDDAMLVNSTACEYFSRSVDFQMEKALGRWNLVYASPPSGQRCRWMELTRAHSSETIPWVNSVRGMLRGVPLHIDSINYKLHHLFGAGSALLEERFGPGAMVFLPSVAALRARPVPRGMTLQLQFKSARRYQYLAFMFCDTEAVYLMARGIPAPARVEAAARDMGVAAGGRVLCGVAKAAPRRRTVLPLRKAQPLKSYPIKNISM